MPKKDIDVILRKESIFSAIINIIGAFTTFFYFTVIDPMPTAEKSIKPFDTIASFIFIFIFGVFMFVGISWGNKHKKNFKKWYHLIDSGEKSPADVPLNIKRDVLNFPFHAAGIAIIMWLSSSLIAAYITQSLRVFIGLMVGGSSIAVTLLYFVDDQLWRPIIPTFFPDGNLREIHAFHLPILEKALIVFLFTGVLTPTLLAVLSWQRAEILPDALNPEVLLENLRVLQTFILSANIIFGVGLTLVITRSITNPLVALRKEMDRVQEDDLDAKVIVTTNDELGYLGERFNQMTSELRQKEMLRNTNSLLRDELEKNKLLETALREQAVRDPLTGLFNRRYMIETLEQELFKALRQKRKFSIVMLDVDHLKLINDKYGHVEGGDQTLKALAKILYNQCRRYDTICRFAGDEFVVILNGAPVKVAYERALIWKDAVSKTQISVGNIEFGFSFSAGVVEYSFQQISSEELLLLADQALYQAKEAGRNQVLIYNDAG